MSNANEMNLAYIEETVFGQIPGGNPQIQDTRYVTESLKQSSSTITSAEVRSDRQITDLVRTGLQADGDLAIEVSYSSHDDLLEAGLLSPDFTVGVTVGPIATISFTAPDTIDDSGNGFGSINAYDIIRVSGATNAANNGVFKVLTAAAGSLTVEEQTIVTDGASAATTVKSADLIVNGTEQRSFAWEKEFLDLVSIFAHYNGMMVDGVSMNFSLEAIISAVFTFLGKSEVSAGATFGDGSNAAAPSTGVMSTIADIEAVIEGGASRPCTEFTFALANNLRNRLQIGTLGAISIGSGTADLTGTFNIYLENSSLIDKFLNFTSSSLRMVMGDAAGNDLIVDLPRIKFSSGERVSGGINTDIEAKMAYQAIRHATENVTIRIGRIAA